MVIEQMTPLGATKEVKKLTDAQLAIMVQTELYKLLGLDARDKQGELMEFIKNHSSKIRKIINENPEIINIARDDAQEAARMLKSKLEEEGVV